MFLLGLIVNLVFVCCYGQTPTVITGTIKPVASDLERAESFYLNGDLFEAERIFRDISKRSSGDTYYKALARLVDIAVKNGDSKLLKNVMEAIKDSKIQMSEPYNSLLYSIGRFLFHSGDCGLSAKFLDKIDRNTPYYFKAVYIKASCSAKNKKYKDALLGFDKLSKSDSEYALKDLKDLAILGKARVFSLLGRFKEALVAYQSITPLSSYYLVSLYETGMLFITKKDYNNALYHLEALSLLDDRNWYVDISGTDHSEDITEFSLMKVKTMRGYIYMENSRFNEANAVFDEVIEEYKGIKKRFSDELNKFKLSDDLTRIISHPYNDGAPRDLDINMDFSIFDNEESYAKAFREWLSIKEKTELKNYLNVYFALNRRVESILSTKTKDKLNDEEIQFIATRNLMNRYLKSYLNMLVGVINNRLDDVGLKAQLGKIDITWKIKESQSRNIKDIQERKQQFIDDIDLKYRGYPE